MTTSKRETIVSYLSGAESGSASREEIQTVGPARCITGYGWAVYCAEVPAGAGIDADYVLFGDGYASDNTDVGWAGYSGTTTQHLQEIKGMLEDSGARYVVCDVELRSNRGMVTSSTRPVLSKMDAEQFGELVRRTQVEKRDGSGYLPR